MRHPCCSLTHTYFCSWYATCYAWAETKGPLIKWCVSEKVLVIYTLDLVSPSSLVGSCWCRFVLPVLSPQSVFAAVFRSESDGFNTCCQETTKSRISGKTIWRKNIWNTSCFPASGNIINSVFFILALSVLNTFHTNWKHTFDSN